MALRRPLVPEEHLLRGVVYQLDVHAGGEDYIVELPAEDGHPEVFRIVDENDYEEEPFEDYGHPPMEDEEDWSDGFSCDSGYSTMTEDDEDLEDEDGEDIRSHSPLVQDPPLPAGARLSAPVCGPAAAPQPQVPVPHQKHPEGAPLSVYQSLEESAPSTSGLSSSTKRTREEDYTGAQQVSMKRLRGGYEETPEESAPSTSGLSSVTSRSREEDYMDSAPSTSGLGVFRGGGYWPGPFGTPRWAEDWDSD